MSNAFKAWSAVLNILMTVAVYSLAGAFSAAQCVRNFRKPREKRSTLKLKIEHCPDGYLWTSWLGLWIHPDNSSGYERIIPGPGNRCHTDELKYVALPSEIRLVLAIEECLVPIRRASEELQQLGKELQQLERIQRQLLKRQRCVSRYLVKETIPKILRVYKRQKDKANGERIKRPLFGLQYVKLGK